MEKKYLMEACKAAELQELTQEYEEATPDFGSGYSARGDIDAGNYLSKNQRSSEVIRNHASFKD